MRIFRLTSANFTGLTFHLGMVLYVNSTLIQCDKNYNKKSITEPIVQLFAYLWGQVQSFGGQSIDEIASRVNIISHVVFFCVIDYRSVALTSL